MEFKNDIYGTIAARGEKTSNEEIEAEIDTILAAIPESMKDVFAAERYERAAAYAKIYYKNLSGDNSKASVTQTQNTATVTKTGTKAKAKKYTIAVDIAPEAKSVIDKYTDEAELAKKINVGKSTITEKILYWKQSTQDLFEQKLLQASYVGTALPEDVKKKYEKGVKAYAAQRKEEGVANTAKFERYIAALTNKEEIPVKYSDSIGGFQGVIISTQGKDGAKGKNAREEKVLNKAEAIEFLIYDSVFVVEVDPSTKLGMRANAILKPKDSTTADSAVDSSNYSPVIVLKIEGQKEAKAKDKDGERKREFIKQLAMKEDGKPETVKGLVTVSDEYCFYYVKDNAEIEEGTGLSKATLVRPKISIKEMPKFELKQGAPYNFEKHFIDTGATFKLPATEAEKKEAADQLKKIYYGIYAGDFKNNSGAFTGSMAKMIKEADAAASSMDEADKEAISNALK